MDFDAARYEIAARARGQRAAAQSTAPRARRQTRACTVARAGMERAMGVACDARTLPYHLSRSLFGGLRAEAAVQFGDAARRCGDRQFAVDRGPHPEHLCIAAEAAGRDSARRRSRPLRPCAGCGESRRTLA